MRRASLVNIYRALVRPHLDYGDIIYDNSSNATFSQMIESVQYNAELAITGAIHGSSRDKLYQELGFESFHDRRWFRKLCFYYKIRQNLCPLYLTELLPILKTNCYSLRSNRAPTVPNVRTERFKSTFFPSCSSNWNQLDPDIKNYFSIEIFKRALLSFICPKPANVYRIHHPRGLPSYAYLGHKLFENLHSNNILLLPLEKSLILQILLYGSDNYNPSMNKVIVSTVIDFIIQSKRFEDPLI